VEFTFTPNSFRISANTPTQISVENVGVAPHNFSIKELGISVNILAGKSQSVTINAAPGTYRFYCNLPGHAQAGMIGTLTVP
jgi:uncharacterized cupredoxin-like copper-binding protein